MHRYFAISFINISPLHQSNYFFIDINECESNPCDVLSNCTNVEGGFTCDDCPIGFTGTGYVATGGCVGILFILKYDILLLTCCRYQ